MLGQNPWSSNNVALNFVMIQITNYGLTSHFYYEHWIF